MVKISVSSVLTLLATAGSLVSGATLTKVNNFGANPTNAEMFIYVPDNVKPNPPILTVIHWCTGTANAIYSGTQYKTYADQYGFIVVYPDAPDAGGCWDVHSSGTLTHNGGGDSLAIANMVRHTISTYNADASRVFAVGVSSGGMMTQVLLGAYPDIFAAGSSWAGVPFSCFSGPDMWNSQCSQGQISKTGAQWGDLVRGAYPGYTGKRPRVQLWHGTLDDVLYFQNFNEAIKQWTNVLGVSENPSATTTNFLGLGWTKYQYGPNIEAIKAEGVTHNVPHQDVEVLKFFGLLDTPAPTTTTRPPTSTPTSTKTTSTTATPTSTSGPVSQKWGQCGGINWTGPTRCVSGTTCTIINPYYHQCL